MGGDDMIPRITIRDVEDADTIRKALAAYAGQRRVEYGRLAAQCGADQIALTLEMNKEGEALMELLRAVGDGTMAAQTTDSKE